MKRSCRSPVALPHRREGKLGAGRRAGERILEPASQLGGRLVLDDAQKRQLAAEMAGMSPAEAEAVLAQDPAVAGARVEITPGWLIKNVPENPDRVVFEDEG